LSQRLIEELATALKGLLRQGRVADANHRDEPDLATAVDNAHAALAKAEARAQQSGNALDQHSPADFAAWLRKRAHENRRLASLPREKWPRLNPDLLKHFAFRFEQGAEILARLERDRDNWSSIAANRNIAIATIAEERDRLSAREPLCPHGLPLAENTCGPCSEGRTNRRPAPPETQAECPGHYKVAARNVCTMFPHCLCSPEARAAEAAEDARCGRESRVKAGAPRE
jgi:hypothetical protein